MKKLFATIALSIVFASATYLFGALVAWDWNPGNWALFGRLFLGICGIVGFFGPIGIYFSDVLSEGKGKC